MIIIMIKTIGGILLQTVLSLIVLCFDMLIFSLSWNILILDFWCWSCCLLYCCQTSELSTLPHLSLSLRSPGGVEVHNESHGTSASNRPAAFLRHCHVCHHRGGVLHGQIPPHLLQDRHWWERQLGCGVCLCNNIDCQLSLCQEKFFLSAVLLSLL